MVLAAALVTAGTGAIALAQTAADLVGLVNAHRSVEQRCEGRTTIPTGPLAANVALARVDPRSAGRLIDALKGVGYQAANAYLITVSGPTDPAAVMRFIAERYCAPLTSPQYTEIGVARNGAEWRIVLARRLLSPDLGDWRRAGSEVLRLVNAARREPRSCGTRSFPTAPPLAWNDKLAAAALDHSRDMAARNYFDHVAPDGSRPGTRAQRAGYAWRDVGENIAGGQGSAEQVTAAWLASPVHCANIMDPAYTEMGAAYFIDARSEATIYWTQVFGRPR